LRDLEVSASLAAFAAACLLGAAFFSSALLGAAFFLLLLLFLLELCH
jgi:hypothetical protein